jgi:hypothetical protein
MAVQPFVGPWPLFQFLDRFTQPVGLFGRGDQPVARPLPAVSRWLPTAAARVRARVWQVGFVVDKVALRQVFSEYFGFRCQSLFH